MTGVSPDPPVITGVVITGVRHDQLVAQFHKHEAEHRLHQTLRDAGYGEEGQNLANVG